MRRLALLVLFVCVLGAAAQQYGNAPDSGDDVISAHDGRGSVSTVYNVFDGYTHAIQVSRLNAGGVVWTYPHSDGLYEKAYAAAMDENVNLFVVGVRRIEKSKSFLTLKYAPNGYLEREVADNRNDCTAVGVAIDAEGGALVAGVCRVGESHPMRLVKYDNDLNPLWSAEYDSGGRNYVRALRVDFRNNVSVTVETVFGNLRDGAYQTRTVVYDPNGRQIELR